MSFVAPSFSKLDGSMNVGGICSRVVDYITIIQGVAGNNCIPTAGHPYLVFVTNNESIVNTLQFLESCNVIALVRVLVLDGAAEPCKIIGLLNRHFCLTQQRGLYTNCKIEI